jgi:DNA-binding protein HU-beta
MAVLSKTDVAEKLAAKGIEINGKPLGKGKAREVLDELVDVVTQAMKSGDEVRLLGFGTFKVKTRAARTGRNPQTGETMNIPEKKVISFKASKTIMD